MTDAKDIVRLGFNKAKRDLEKSGFKVEFKEAGEIDSKFLL